MTAMNFGVWKLHHLFHDWYKPWMALFVDYNKMHNYHITHSNHHIEHYRLTDKCNWLDLVIDWECSQYTKVHGKRTAREFLEFMTSNHEISSTEYDFINKVLVQLDL
ncbi:MAG: hypothetical protein MJ224_06410 [archaeon]|nr:hypothetical protein [archaeon]